MGSPRGGSRDQEHLSPHQIPAILSHVADAMIDEALSAAHAALSIRQGSPSDSLAAANAVLVRVDVSDVAKLVALWAAGLAERELNRLEPAEQHLRDAIALGTTIGERVLLAQVSSALVVVFGRAWQTGRSARARRVGRRRCARLRRPIEPTWNCGERSSSSRWGGSTRRSTRTPPHCRSSGPTATPCSRLAFVATEPWSTHFRAASRKRSPIRRSPSSWPPPTSSTSSLVARRTTTRSPPGSRATS